MRMISNYSKTCMPENKNRGKHFLNTLIALMLRAETIKSQQLKDLYRNMYFSYQRRILRSDSVRKLSRETAICVHLSALEKVEVKSEGRTKETARDIPTIIAVYSHDILTNIAM